MKTTTVLIQDVLNRAAAMLGMVNSLLEKHITDNPNWAPWHDLDLKAFNHETQRFAAHFSEGAKAAIQAPDDDKLARDVMAGLERAAKQAGFKRVDDKTDAAGYTASVFRLAPPKRPFSLFDHIRRGGEKRDDFNNDGKYRGILIHGGSPFAAFIGDVPIDDLTPPNMGTGSSGPDKCKSCGQESCPMYHGPKEIRVPIQVRHDVPAGFVGIADASGRILAWGILPSTAKKD